MATMYFRGNANANWHQRTVGDWSNTSGGPSNAGVPDGTTDVVFDSNSWAGAVIINEDTPAGGASGEGVSCRNIATSGWGGSFISNNAGERIHCYGNADLSGVTSVGAQAARLIFTLHSTAGNAFYPAASMDVVEVNGGTILTGPLVCATLTVNASPGLDANGLNVTSNFVTVIGQLKMGAGVWTLTGGSGGVWDASNGGASVLAGTSTILLSAISPVGGVTFAGGGKTYNDLIINSEISATITGNNTFRSLQVAAGQTLKFGPSSTTTVTSLTLLGTKISPVTLASVSGTFNLAKASAGASYSDFASISNCAASPAATWFARSSIDGGGNSGWKFIPANSNFLTFF